MSDVSVPQTVDADVVGQGPKRDRSADQELSERRVNTRRRQAILIGARIVLLAAAIGLWQVASGRWLDPFWLSSPRDVLSKLGELVATDSGGSVWSVITHLPESDLWRHLSYTLQAMLLGLLWGTIGGITLGFLLGRSRFVGDLLNPLLVALYSMPKLALAPLFILWFGIGLKTKIVYAATVVFFLIFLNTFTGVREVSRDLVDAVRILGAGRFAVIAKVVLPSAMTWVFAGLTLSVPYSLVGAVTAEMFASNRGMGYLVVRAANQFDTGGVFAALIVLVAMAALVNYLVGRLRGYLLRWQQAGS